MGKLRVMSGEEVCRILREHGFVEVRHRGSHVAGRLEKLAQLELCVNRDL